MGIGITGKPDSRQAGAGGPFINSTRAGFLPVTLERLPLAALAGIDVHIKTHSAGGELDTFTLFRGRSISFTEDNRRRLTASGVKFIYIPIAQQTQFRMQTEAALLQVAGDSNIEGSARAKLIYETSIELVNEVLADPDLAVMSPRLETVSRAVTLLVLNDPTAFSHLFATAHHDFYTAAHMVNVATWMVPLAHAMGHHDADELSRICQAGLLHDIGKKSIPVDVLNKHGDLSEQDWAAIRRHPELGQAYLAQHRGIHPIVGVVALQHHERMDGTGYPNKLAGNQIDPISRICGVVDSFDAMTAFRPFKKGTMSVNDAMNRIISESPSKYDPTVVNAWLGLMNTTQKIIVPRPFSAGAKGHRDCERFRIDCPARLHLLEKRDGEWYEDLGLPLVAHNISQSGLGMVSQKPIAVGEPVRVYVMGESSLNRVSEGTTIHCRQYQEGWYEIGVRFMSLDAQRENPLRVAS